MPSAPSLPDTLEYTPEVAEATAPVFERLRSVIPEVEWPIHAPYIYRIQELKRERNAVILAHNYQTPEIFFGVADFRGDSLALAQEGASTDADVIVMCGVHFMAETAKITSPEKTVLIPDLRAGCSLAESITAEDVRALRAQHPGVPVVTYVNTSAAVKAESDICCTSSNAVRIVESLGVDRVLFLPDQYLAKYVATQTDVQIIEWTGHCEVHELFTAEEIRRYRAATPGLAVLVHPECPPEVIAEADYVGSTKGMADYVRDRQPEHVALITECSMSDNVAAENPEVNFVRPCNLCPHMKRITLPGIARALERMEHQVEVDPVIGARARLAVERMLAVGRG